MNKNSFALKRAIASPVVNSTSTCLTVDVEPSVVPECFTYKYAIPVLAALIVVSLGVAVAACICSAKLDAVCALATPLTNSPDCICLCTGLFNRVALP